MSPRTQTGLAVVLGTLLLGIGALHFVVPGLFEQIVPPVLPARRMLVWLSGVAELLLGAGLLWPRTRGLAAWGAIALFVAVFPANIYMAVANVQIEGLPAGMAQPGVVARWARLPFQVVLVAWAYVLTRRAL